MVKEFDIKKEQWDTKDGKRITKVVARYSEGSKKGQIFTQQTIKRTESIDEYKRRFRATQSFNPSVKDVEVFSTGVRKIISNKPVKRKSDTQIGCTLLIRKKYAREPTEFKGFSNRGVDKETGQQQSYGMAVSQATTSGYIKYDELSTADVSINYYYIAYV